MTTKPKLSDDIQYEILLAFGSVHCCQGCVVEYWENVWALLHAGHRYYAPYPEYPPSPSRGMDYLQSVWEWQSALHIEEVTADGKESK